MRKKLIVFSCLILISLFHNVFSAPLKRKTINGIVYINGQASYLDTHGMWYAAVKQDVKPQATRPVPKSILLTKKDIGIPRNMSKDLNPGNWRTLYYKVENDLGYVSDDNKDWRPMQVQVLQVGPKCEHEKGVFLQKVYLECEFFAGVFDDVSVFSKPPEKGLKACE